MNNEIYASFGTLVFHTPHRMHSSTLLTDATFCMLPTHHFSLDFDPLWVLERTLHLMVSDSGLTSFIYIENLKSFFSISLIFGKMQLLFIIDLK